MNAARNHLKQPQQQTASALVDEDYIARRLLNGGSFKRHTQQRATPAQVSASAGAEQTPLPLAVAGAQVNGAISANQTTNGHHRPSSSCASSSPSPTSSLSTLSPSPSSSASPELELGLVRQKQVLAQLPARQAATPNRYNPSAVGSLHHQQQRSQLATAAAAAAAASHQQQLHLSLPSARLMFARSPVSPTSDTMHSNSGYVSSAFSSASSSPVPPRLTTTTTTTTSMTVTPQPQSQCNVTNSALSQISRLSLHCAATDPLAAAAAAAAAAANHTCLMQDYSSAKTTHALHPSGPATTTPLPGLLRSAKAAPDRGGNFGLLADVATIAAAAEEQSRLAAAAAVAAAAAAEAASQPIDLSKK